MNKCASSETGARSKDVLIADPAICHNNKLASVFRERGFDVSIASSLDVAQALARHRSFDFALVELKFGRSNSLEFLELFRATNPAARVLVHTWYASIPATVAVVKAGADDLLPKPTGMEFVADLLTLHGTHAFRWDTEIPEADYVRRLHIEAMFRLSGSNMSLTSRRLALNRRSLQRLMIRYREAETLEYGIDLSLPDPKR